MCGIAGILDAAGRSRAELEAEARAMAATLAHRGPDESGSWADAEAGLALAHRRLSILDLSSAGSQPMRSAGGGYVICYNGEVYNHEALRQELAQAGAQLRFRGHSDTEVMLAAMEHWGVVPAVERFRGMFAFALWDARERALYLVRDRLGEKPLYYGWSGGALRFGSELKALCAAPGEREISRQALSLYFRYNSIPAPYSIYRGIFKLPPACYVRVTREQRSAAPVRYWDLEQIAERGVAQPFSGSEAEACEQLEARLGECVRQRMIADVPLGAFLSGGIDSSLITALMQRQGRRAAKTFSIGLRDSAYDESANARQVAQHLGSDHAELIVEARQALELVPRLAAIYDEPFADSSQIPTLLLSQLARQEVKVSLSGDGGDEVFGGYTRYSWVGRVWKAVGWMPRGARAALGRALTALPARTWNALFRAGAPLVPSQLRQRLPGDKLHKLAPLLAAPDARALYEGLAAHWRGGAPLLVAADPASPRPQGGEFRGNLLAEMMCLDTMNYLPTDVLTKVDRASMAFSLEVRAPFLDHQLAEFAWQLPPAMKVRGGQGKYILRQLLARYVPNELWERPKMGFGIPLDSWLRGPLRAWAEELLAPARLEREGYLDPAPVQEKWQEHLSGRHDWQHHLWDVLMFEAWLEAEKRNAREPCAAGMARA